MGTVSHADLAEGICKMVEADAGKMRYKPRDLEKGMTKKFGEGSFSKEDFKAALKDLHGQRPSGLWVLWRGLGGAAAPGRLLEVAFRVSGRH